MYGQNRTMHSAFIVIIKTHSYLLKIDRSTNKQYLCDSNFEDTILKCIRKYLIV